MIQLLQRKKQQNIAGYVISMWHLEDLMRANRFDMDRIDELLIAPLDTDRTNKGRIREEYVRMAQSMKEQGIEQAGHLQEVTEVLNELQFLHTSLLGVLGDEEYISKYQAASGGIEALIAQSTGKVKGEVEACFNGIYGVLVLKARNGAISEATLRDEKLLRELLAILSERYKSMRSLPGVSMN